MLYKGNLIEVKDILVDYKTLVCSILDKNVAEYIDYKMVDLSKITEKENKILYSYLMDKNMHFNKRKEEVTTEKIISILDLIYSENKNSYYECDCKEIIFEKVIDEDGNEYARELFSGRLFPVSNKETRKNRYSIIKSSVDYRDYRDNELHIKVEFTHPMYSKIEVAVVKSQVANQNEIEAYKSMFNKGFGRDKKRKRDEFIKQMNFEANKNIQKRDIEVYRKEELPKKEREKQDKIITTIENIEYLLLRLKKINKESYIKYNELYNKALQEENILNRNNIQISTLVSLEAKIEFELLFTKGENTTLSEQLEKLEQDYLSRLSMDESEKTRITLNDLDKLMELFLKTKKDYSILEQRKIIRCFATIYTLEVKENQDKIRVERLENSYFNDIKKSIILCIDTLIEEGYIEDNIMLGLNKEANIEEILELIKNLEVVKDKNKKLVL